eukprot:13353794-Alexandrium_andersonii.AAC.1
MGLDAAIFRLHERNWGSRVGPQASEDISTTFALNVQLLPKPLSPQGNGPRCSATASLESR